MTQLVGILNVTPDSFSDGGMFMAPLAAIAQAEKLFMDGAALVDVGAESTRPGATPLTADQEWQRLESILPVLIERFANKISVDTYHPETAVKALAFGDVIINDITGFSNPAMADVIIEHQARCIIGQLPAANPQAAHKGELIDDIKIVKNDLLSKAASLEARGLERDKIILDPGIGFGKTANLNLKLQEFASEVPDYKVMIGYSRKRHLGERRFDLKPNLQAGKLAIGAGTAYLRVHDVAGHRQILPV